MPRTAPWNKSRNSSFPAWAGAGGSVVFFIVLVGSKRSFQTAGAKAPPGQPALLHFNILTKKNPLPTRSVMAPTNPFDRTNRKSQSGNTAPFDRRTSKPVEAIALSSCGGTNATAFKLGRVMETNTSPAIISCRARLGALATGIDFGSVMSFAWFSTLAMST